MPSDCCYFVGKAAAAGAAPALKYFCSILHCPAVFTQNWGQTRVRLKYAAMNLKKLAEWSWNNSFFYLITSLFSTIYADVPAFA